LVNKIGKQRKAKTKKLLKNMLKENLICLKYSQVLTPDWAKYFRPMHFLFDYSILQNKKLYQ